jgi:hypothetical protein
MGFRADRTPDRRIERIHCGQATRAISSLMISEDLRHQEHRGITQAGKTAVVPTGALSRKGGKGATSLW